MAVSPEVLALLENMLDSGRTAEDLCRDRPELLAEVRHRWRAFCQVDEAVAAFLPDTEPAVDAESRVTDLPQVPGYRVEAELGRGGMGVVYLAWHEGLKRPVALKMLLAGRYASRTERERFQREAQAVAALKHPNIVQVYDVGEMAGQPYFTMELVDGGSLADEIRGVPQPSQKAAQLVATLAEAASVAHQAGIVHRDLKPANILFTREGTPQITDFGLARRLGGNEDLTISGTPVGTPSYMSPCQARGDKTVLGPATDVYALGAILYDCLTGRPPFHADTATATLQQVLTDDPIPPARLNPRVPRDLQTICLKCLEKEPQRRYPSGAELAADLRRFIRHEPIWARPVGFIGRSARWARRHPAITSLTATLVVTAIVAFTLILWQWRAAETARALADRTATRLVLDRGIILCERGQIGLGLHSFALGIEQAEQAGDADLMPALCANLTAWSDRHVVPRVSPPFGSAVTAVAFHPDGKRLLVSRWQDAFNKPGPGEARVVDADNWEPLGPPMEHPGGVRKAVFSPDGTRVLTADVSGTVRLWDTDSGRHLGNPLRFNAEILAVAFEPKGEAFATTSVTSATTSETRIWNTVTGQPFTPVMPQCGKAYCLAFSPDGKTLLTGGTGARTWDQPNGGEARFWDSRTGLPAGPVLVHAAPIRTVAFSPDGQTVVTGSEDGLLLRWRLQTREAISPPLHHLAALRAAVFSPNGHSLLTGDGLRGRPKEQEHAVRLWDVDSGNLLASPWAHPDDVVSISYRPDGRRFATGCRDGHVRIFRLGTLQPKRYRYLEGIQTAPLYVGDRKIARGDVAAAFSPNGRHLLAGGDTPDGQEAARLVDVLTGSTRDLLPDRKSLLVNAVRAAGVPALMAGGGGLSSLGAVPIPRTRGSFIEDVTFGPDGTIAATTGRGEGRMTVITGGGDSTIRLWDVKSAGLVLGPLSLGDKKNRPLTLLPDEHTLVTGGLGRPVEIWNRDSGKRVAGPLVGDDLIEANALSPDGRTLATAGVGGIIQLWDARTGQFRTRFDAVAKTIWALCFSQDGRTLLAGGERTAWLFDVSTGKQRCQQLSHSATVWEAQFSPDGTRVLTVCSDEYRDLHPGTVQIWDVRSGTPTGPPLPHPVAGLAAAFDPEGSLVATGGFDGDVRFWDAATAAPVGPALVQSGPVPAIAFVSGTNLLAAAGRDGNLALWPVPEPRKGNAKEVRAWVQSIIGQVFDETDAVLDRK